MGGMIGKRKVIVRVGQRAASQVDSFVGGGKMVKRKVNKGGMNLGRPA